MTLSFIIILLGLESVMKYVVQVLEIWVLVYFTVPNTEINETTTSLYNDSRL